MSARAPQHWRPHRDAGHAEAPPRSQGLDATFNASARPSATARPPEPGRLMRNPERRARSKDPGPGAERSRERRVRSRPINEAALPMRAALLMNLGAFQTIRSFRRSLTSSRLNLIDRHFHDARSVALPTAGINPFRSATASATCCRSRTQRSPEYVELDSANTLTSVVGYRGSARGSPTRMRERRSVGRQEPDQLSVGLGELKCLEFFPRDPLHLLT